MATSTVCSNCGSEGHVNKSNPCEACGGTTAIHSLTYKERQERGQQQLSGQPPVQPSVVYVQPPAQYSTSGLGIASMVLGIVWIYWIGSVLAVIFGHVALSQIRKNPSIQGRGMALAGAILGWIGLGVLLIILIAGISVVFWTAQ